MADILQALTWLNQWGESKIESMSRFWINQIEDPNQVEGEKKDTIRVLAGSIRNIVNPLEKAEILVHCGVHGYRLSMMDEAINWLDQAEKLYIYDTHRQAVTYWIQYLVHRKSGKYQRAVTLAWRARRQFWELADQSLIRKQYEIEGWYRGRIIDMTCDLIDSPEVVFELLFEYHGTYLITSSAQIKAKISEFLENGATEEVLDKMQLLLGVSLKASQPEETGEALAFCGVIHWLFDNRTEALQFLRSALTQFIPGSHEYAYICWMIGLAMFDHPGERHEAIQQMENSIVYIDSLRKAQIQKNHPGEANLFEVYQSAMRRVLRTMISRAV